MRISSIHVAQPKNVSYNLRTRKIQEQTTLSQPQSEPSFKGWGGALGTIGGAIVGVALTAASGGALAWTIPAISGLSGIGGDMYEKKDEPSTDQYGR